MKKKHGGDDSKKDKKILHKKKKVMQLVKPINYQSGLIQSQISLIKFVESWRYNIIFYICYIVYIIYYISETESNKFDNIYNKI